MEEQLRLLQQQFEEGYISEAVYNQRRQALISQQGIPPTQQNYDAFLADQNSQGAVDFMNRNIPAGQGLFGNPSGLNLTTPSNSGITSDIVYPNNTGISGGDMYSNPVKQTYQTVPSTTTAIPTASYPYPQEEDPNQLQRLEPRSVQEVWNNTYTPPTAQNTPLAPNSWQEPTQPQNSLFEQMMPFFNPYGTNIQTDLYSLGNFIGQPKGATGRGLGIASSATALGLGAGRTFLSGLANAKQTNRATEEARRQMAQRLYTPQMQYMNNNYLGGTM